MFVASCTVCEMLIAAQAKGSCLVAPNPCAFGGPCCDGNTLRAAVSRDVSWAARVAHHLDRALFAVQRRAMLRALLQQCAMVGVARWHQ